MIGTTLNGRFRLDRELGRGGMGSVYQATDNVLQRTVAIKILKDRAGEEVGAKIRLEAQILARLVHDCIVRIYDFGVSDGLYYFVMEEVAGSTLHHRLHQLPMNQRLRVLAEVADALDYAHHQGVIHRDIKPANVLTTANDRAKLSDFGLSLLVEDQPHETKMLRGTPAYMSPEQAKGRRLDHRTDLYSLGVMLYECVTGAPPFTGPPLSVIACQASAPPDPPRSRSPGISAELEALILRLLEKEPAARPSSGSKIAQWLRALMETESRQTEFTQPSGSIIRRSQTSVEQLSSRQPTRATLVQTPWEPFSNASSPSASVVGSGPTSTTSARSGTPAEFALAMARGMVDDVIADPVVLSPDERYLTGHYLAYLLGGSRRTGFLGRRPLDALNGDRARLILAMAWLGLREPDEESIQSAARLLDDRPEIRSLLNPVVVTKYLALRDSPGRRKRFRQIRRLLQEASSRARDQLTDSRGSLNPGLMPQVLDDLRKVAPAKTEVDDQLVSRWNRVADVWRARDDLRVSVLKYATSSAWSSPSSVALWPEVVYPLIERARRHRQLRSIPEAILDHICGALRLPDAGLRFDRAIVSHVPQQVVEKIDLSLNLLADDPILDAEIDQVPSDATDRLARKPGANAISLHELTADIAPERGFVRLVEPDPHRFTMEELHQLWKEAIVVLQKPNPQERAALRRLPVGPYRLSVVASVRGRSAGQVVLQGMPSHKQIEMLTPTLRVSSSRTIVAIWVYQEDSLVITFNDFRNVVRYISWHAPTSVQTNYDDPADLNHDLLQLGLESPDQLGEALTRRFRPKFVSD